MEDKEILVKVEGVSKKFSKDLKAGLKYGLQDLFSNVFGNRRSDQLRPKEFWAVQDINFELRRGECMGLIGHNGAGKSTLLKMLNGLIRPDTGTITMKGRVGALIELGAGFNPILTGRENIYNNGAVLGFTKKEIDDKLEDIIDFAEMHEFIDMPIQHYSSGMKVRLGFAVAAQMEPDILLIDEVLAVGDLGFRIKCINRIQELIRTTAFIFVSHSMAQIAQVCTEILLMDSGKLEYHGADVGKGIENYFSRFSGNQLQVLSSKNISLQRIHLNSKNNETLNGQLIINTGDGLSIDIECKSENHHNPIQMRVGVFNLEYRLVAEIDSGRDKSFTFDEDGILKVNLSINDLFLRHGKYYLHLHIVDVKTKEKVLRLSDVASFLVRNPTSTGADYLLPGNWEQL